MQIDVFNGDADGICALIHLRLGGQDQNGGMDPRLADALENLQSWQ